MKIIKFSIIMAAYNAEKYIEEAIESVLKQTYQNWELIIVNDGSTDKTPEIIDEFAKRDDRIKIIHQNNSGTASAARNSALKIAEGDYSQMLDADDMISENMLYVYSEMLNDKNYDIISPIVEYFKNDGTILWQKGAPENNYQLVISGEKAFEYSIDWTVHGVFLVRMDLLKRVKYDTELINGDELTTRKLFYYAERIGFCEEKYFYRNNMDSTTKSHKNEVRMYETLETYYKLYEFSKEERMDKTIQKKCAQKLTSAIIYQTSCYVERKYLYDRDACGKIETILKNVFNRLSKREWFYTKVIYYPLILIGMHDYSVFEKNILIMCKLKKWLKGVR